jgi:S-methylmethionine-dependent homocysteine/selenocysteine methylase
MSSAQVTVLDGGMGRELWRMGAPFRQPEWSALALTEGPDWVVRAHRNFIDAGADVIITNSYAIVPFHIGESRFAAEAHDLAATAGRLARRAADDSTRSIRIAGSLPPLFGSYRPDLFDAADAPRIIDPLIAGMADDVDLWLGETLGSIAEAQAVRAALDRAAQTTLPLWISYTLDDRHRGILPSGEPVADAVAAAIDVGATGVLFNCAQAETITAAIDITAGLVDDATEFGGYANRFAAEHTHAAANSGGDPSFRDDLSPENYSAVVSGWLDIGATIVGGCCGMGPEHIAEIAAVR